MTDTKSVLRRRPKLAKFAGKKDMSNSDLFTRREVTGIVCIVAVVSLALGLLFGVALGGK